MTKICPKCSAKKWVDEANGMCCTSGKTAHPGRYNAPAVNEVAVLLVDEEKGPRDIVLHGRDGQLKRVSELHRSDLFSQFIVDMMAKIISERLNYICRNQQRLRTEEYIHLRDALNQDGNVDPSNIGQRVILPSSFTGSPRYLHEKTQDAMTYVRNSERPDLFVTFTCNPEWPDIKAKLLPVKCFMASVEWQNRGLPHYHILFWLETKIQPDEIDSLIVVELPNQQNDPILFDIVTKNMVHGPCGEHNLTAPCIRNGICTKKFPRRLVNETQTGEDEYPAYRRRDTANGGQSASLNIRGSNLTIDNSWIVPYSPLLCRAFNAHINVEYCHSVQAIEYICKYINKGSDQATFGVRNPNDEVENYVNGRCISTSEAAWMLLHHVRGPTSFQHLKTVDVVLKETYQAACRARSLLENDDHWENTLREASLLQCPIQLRESFKDDLCEDVRHRIRQENQDFALPYNENIYNEENNVADTMAHHYDTNDLTAFVNEDLPKLVPHQKHAFETTVDSVNSDKQEIFFLDAPGGTGKTFLANLILAKVKESGKIAIAVASSGIAATLLRGGKTAHSNFKLPLSVNLEQQSTCSIRKNGSLGELLQDTSLVMWDECTMSHRAHIEAVNRTLKDLRNSSAVMGGITFVFAGDFRQTLPVINRDAVYPDIENLHEQDFHWLCSRAIMSPKKDTVNEINNLIVQKVSGQMKKYRSIDTVTNIQDTVHYPQEFLNSLNPSGLPPHELTLKIGIPIMLLRNLSPPSMCNGTRLLIKELKENIIVATIMTGPATGELAHIPRIPMIPTDLSIPYKRLHFPVKTFFALTINKSQSQTFE
ncbi:uncharacterized protein [Neodiprion pinetum]|uniref:uncharacterized protein n=1 Tax=Neodiprion pinetum TaxID=441929 RepID=UPI003715407D